MKKKTDTSKKEPISIHKKMYWIIGVSCVVLGITAGYFIGSAYTLRFTKNVIESIHSVRESSDQYHFIHPLLLYSLAGARPFLEKQPLENKLHTYIQEQTGSGKATSVSVSIRYLDDGHWAGINQDAQYHPASMLKVLIMMAYYREAELNPNVLKKYLTYSALTNAEVNAIPNRLSTKLVVGESLTVDALIDLMIKESDNGAEQLLVDTVHHTDLNKAYTDLGVSNPDEVSDYTISPAQYVGFLRILYNATYLSQAFSEKALSLMSQSTFTQGIAAGVPTGVVVAQKYGEHIDTDKAGTQIVELHNCGIVYAKDAPYALCIMTKGTDVNQLITILKDISGVVYGYIKPNITK